MRTIIILLLASLCCPALAPDRAEAHPHVYVDVSLTFRLDDAGLSGVHQSWLFDEMFTRAILSDLGLDAASLATPQGQAAVRDGAFQYLSNYHYFTLVEAGGERLPVRVEHFRAGLKGNRFVYDFDVPLDLPVDRLADFRMAVFDRDYYTDMIYAENGVRFDVQGGIAVSHAMRPARDQTYWRYIVPDAVHLSVSAIPGASPAVAEGETDEPGLLARFMGLVRSAQKALTARLDAFGVQLADDPWGPALWMFLGLSFVYGVVHAVGPGHGKAVVCSWFLSRPGSLMTGALMGNAITFVHMGSAVLAVGAAYLVFSTGMGGFAAASRAIQPAGYGLLALMGLFLLVKAVFDLRRGGLLAADACARAEPEGENLRSILAVSFVTGLIPCPGAAVILAFAIGLNILWTGLAALVVMALGMGLTTTLFAWFAVSARKAALTLSGRNRRLFNVLHAGLSLCGAAAICLLGTVLLVGSLTV
ncbi:protein of unknown function DUF1007 [Pseudodesulfovibrio mercurii]|uniref:Nickel/cobalt efflux system n=1 Tax=Pseudodesulfovibrio mercurii TaxID=641491 RepID=F0JGA8_9BACT|nr:DUF1007 family protein [Pseudodesulfovibrio mercurii]EGB15025.1 protein of unknown function DUF1007 [Pseudodesulfovibrio mercurii]